MCTDLYQGDDRDNRHGTLEARCLNGSCQPSDESFHFLLRLLVLIVQASRFLLLRAPEESFGRGRWRGNRSYFWDFSSDQSYLAWLSTALSYSLVSHS